MSEDSENQVISEEVVSLEDIGDIEEQTPVELVKKFKPTVKELYAILFKNKEPLVYEVSSIEENIATLQYKDTKELIVLDDDGSIIMKKNDYEILDIERVILFDLKILKEDLSQLEKKLTSEIVKGLDISLDEIKDKDIVYTETELREELLSSLIRSFDAYEKINSITILNNYINDIFSILKSDKLDYIDSKLQDIPNWLIPIVDNPTKVYESDVLVLGEPIDESVEVINTLSELPTNGTNHYQIYRTMLDILRPVNPSLSDVGYTTSGIRKYLRDCLIDSSCIGINGNYTYDKRFNKLSYESNKEIIHNSDNLNISGLLYIPDNQLIQCLDVMKTINTSLSHKIRLQKMINHNYTSILNLRKKNIYPEYLNESEQSIDNLDRLVSYLFTERVNTESFFQQIEKITPTIDQLLQNIDSDLRSKLLNYDDFELLMIKYNFNSTKLSKESKHKINKLLTDNYKEYIKHIDVIPKVVLTYIKKELTIDYKISKSKELIFAMNSIAIRNEYLQLFLNLFTREPTKKEDKNTLYNIYTNQPILCKHYLFSSRYHKDPKIHQTMLSIYGKPPEDGIIYCKHCGEYLCDEEFSAFDGFVDETPIQLREVMKSDTNILESYSEELILLVKQITTSFGITVKDEDIDFVLSIYSTLNQDKILSIRYNSPNIPDTHPLIKDIKTKFAKDKHKKEKIKTELKKLQIYFKDTNKLLSIVSLCILMIQTTIPTYKNKFNFKFNLLECNDDNLQNIKFKTSVIDYCILKLDKLASIQSIPFWKNYSQLSSEEKTYDLTTVKKQIMNLIHVFISPQYNKIQTRILDYHRYVTTATNDYIRDEWVLYKPLRKNKDILKVDDFLQSKQEEYKQHYILNYNNYPIENVSLIEPLSQSSMKYISEYLKIPVSEIMINKSFLLIFKLTLSHYGVYKGKSDRVYLHIERFLDTIKQKEKIESIFTKHGYSRDKFISYKLLRNKIIPDIINHYQKDSELLETCYSDESKCNRFLHININNYDYFMLKVYPKRYYSYKQPRVYPYKQYEDLSEEFINKLFRRYCKDPNDTITYRQINTNYLGKVLLVDELNVELTDESKQIEIALTKDEKNYKIILEAIQSKLLSMSLYDKPSVITIDDYKKDILPQYIDSEQRLIQVLQKNNLFEIDDVPIIDEINKVIKSDLVKLNKELADREFNSLFSLLSIDNFIINTSAFIQGIVSKPHKKRFENIFINTSDSINLSDEERQRLEKDNFRYRNLRETDIAKILVFFTNDKRLTINLVRTYISHLRNILARLKNKSETINHIPKAWKLDEKNRSEYSHYIKHNSNYLYQDLFKQNVVYTGYNEYNTYNYIFSAILKYIDPYLNKLDRLQPSNQSILTSSHMLQLNRYILMFILDKLIDFHVKVKQNDEEILSLLEEFINPDEDLNIPLVEQYTEYFIMDYVTDIFQMHYDSKWIVSNTNKDDLTKRLSKQKEKEKQALIHKLDTMSDEKRLLTMEKQKHGVINFFKTSGQENVQRVVDEYTNTPDDERYTMFNNIMSSDNIVDEVVGMYGGELPEESVNQVTILPEQGEDSYMDIEDIDEDGQLGDELHEFHSEDLLDSNFEV